MSSDNQKLVSSLCQQLHSRGHALVPGTGYAIKDGEHVFIPPGEVHLDRLEQEDVFTFNTEFDSDGNPELSREAASPCHNISAYTNLFLRVFQDFDCGCVIYAQPTSAMVVSEIFSKQFKIRNNQLITQISNGETKEQYPWTHELMVPIINNPDDQTKMFDKLEDAFTKNPETNAVIVKGNGLVVCGDTWQETKLMFETLLQLFDVALEMSKVGAGRVENVSAPVTRKVTPLKKNNPKNDNDSEIAVVHESTPGNKKPTIKPYVAKKPAAQLPTDIRTRMADDRYKAEALKRKKLAITRLRDRTAVTSQRRPMPSHRRDAASFMNNMSNDQVVFGSMDTSMNSMNNSMNSMNSMNQPMNNMNMNQQMMMNMMMNQNMMEQQFMGNTMMNNMDVGGASSFERAGRRSSRGRGVASRGRSLRVTPGGAVRKSFASRKGPVKERLGFKSNITVDPSLLTGGAVNEEDY